jgi:hypothetical protein
MIAVDLINENRPVSQFGPPVGLFLIAVYGYTHAGPTASVAAKSIQEVVDLNHIEQRISDFFCSSVYRRMITSFGLIRIRCDGSWRALFRSIRIEIELPHGNSRTTIASDG